MIYFGDLRAWARTQAVRQAGSLDLEQLLAERAATGQGDVEAIGLSIRRYRPFPSDGFLVQGHLTDYTSTIDEVTR